MSTLHLNAHTSRPISNLLATADRPDEFVVFMQNRATCETCRMMDKFGARQHMGLLHVVVSGEDLIVTAADCLHQPSLSISARKLLQLPGSTIYHLQRECPRRCDSALHRPATGVAVLSWGKRQRRLVVTGVIEGMVCASDRLIDANEHALHP